MEGSLATTTTCVILVTILMLAWKLLYSLWLRPKKLERRLREQGLEGNPYKILGGDARQMLKMQKEAKSKPMDLSDDIAPRVLTFVHHTVNNYGMFLARIVSTFNNFDIFVSRAIKYYDDFKLWSIVIILL